jgi:hypothetical protein
LEVPAKGKAVTLRNLAHSLIAAERRESDSTETDGLAAFRVCEKLRQSLSTLAGARGSSTLLTRALALARREVPWLGQLKVGSAGSLSPDGSEDVGPSEIARGGVALVAHLLELLATFIGEALTRRLVQQIWPKAALEAPKSGGKT